MTEAWTVPGFTEVRELGRGSSGRVAVVVDDVTQTPAVIKYIDPRLLRDPSFHERYAKEMRLLTHVEDPNLVQVMADVETPAGGLAVVMEAIDGVALRDMLRGLGPLGPLAALVVYSHSLIGLASAHAVGVLHRDYRPENVLVDSHGLCKLTDLGLAVPHGSTGLVGHPSYAAPELWSGAEPSTASDIYAATAVFFECLTGRRPYRSQKSSESRAMAALAKAHREEPVPVEGVPGPLRDLLLMGMAKHPAERPASAAEFVAVIDDAAVSAYGLSWEGQGRSRLTEIADLIISSPPPPRERAPSRARQHGGPAAQPSRAEAPPSPFEPRSDPGADPGFDPRAGSGPGQGSGSGPRPAAGYGPGPGAWPPAPSRSSGGTGAREGTEASPYAAAANGSAVEHHAGGDDGSGGRANGGRAGGDAGRAGSIRLWHVVAAACGVALLAGAVIYALSGGDEPRPTRPSAQGSTPTPTPTVSAGTDDAPATAAALSARITRATSARRSAAFSYRADTPGTTDTAAKGVFQLVPRGSTSYDLTARNATAGGLRQRPTRVLLVGGTAYVRTATGWRSVPATGAGTGRGDDAAEYAAMAAESRWASSVYDITALLGARTSLKRTGLTYRGTAAPARLLRAAAVAPLYRTLFRSAPQPRVSFVIEVDKDFLPRRIQITIAPAQRPAAATTLRVRYSDWGRTTTIRAPR